MGFKAILGNNIVSMKRLFGCSGAFFPLAIVMLEQGNDDETNFALNS